MGSDNLFHLKKRGQLKRQSSRLKEYKNSILIICEGEQTEPNYFQSFPVSNIRVKTIGTGRNTTSLVAEAVRKWKEFAHDGKFFERLWCVFDRDDFPLQLYNKAFEDIVKETRKLNRKYKKNVKREIEICIAYSNEAFELWYLLHYDYIDSTITRSEYKRMLSQRMGKEYQKNDLEIYHLLDDLSKRTNNQKGQNFANSNAERLREGYNLTDRHNHCPSTNVDALVLQLNENLKK